MTKLTESAIEDFAIEQFEQLGYQYVYGPSIAPDAVTPERDRWDEVSLAGWQVPGRLGRDPEKCYRFSGFSSGAFT